MKVLTGTSGWNYDHWKGVFYPEDIAKKDWFGYFITQFNTVEINYSFYRWPSSQTMKKWYENSPKDFIFTMKAPRIITHVKKLNDVENSVKDFYNLTSLLKKKLGAHLFQLPPSFKNNEENLDKLMKFLKILDKKKENVIEFRDPGWWRESIFDLFKKEKVVFCSVNGLDMPKDIIKTTDMIYNRLHGEDYTVNYKNRELKKIAGKIKQNKPKKVYAYFNNDYNAYAPNNAKFFGEELS